MKNWDICDAQGHPTNEVWLRIESNYCTPHVMGPYWLTKTALVTGGYQLDAAQLAIIKETDFIVLFQVSKGDTSVGCNLVWEFNTQLTAETEGDPNLCMILYDVDPNVQGKHKVKRSVRRVSDPKMISN